MGRDGSVCPSGRRLPLLSSAQCSESCRKLWPVYRPHASTKFHECIHGSAFRNCWLPEVPYCADSQCPYYGQLSPQRRVYFAQNPVPNCWVWSRTCFHEKHLRCCFQGLRVKSRLKKPVRILHVLGVMNRGGIETWLMHVLRHINRERFHM